MGRGPTLSQSEAAKAVTGVDASQSMAGHVGSGMTWLMVNFGLSKSLVVVAQVLLGWILTPADFGVYALSVAVTSLVTVFKDGGIRELLVQRWQEYPQLVGPVFWLGVAVNIVAGLALAAIAPLAAWAYDEPSLFWMVLITAIWIPLSSTFSIQYVKLRLDLRFKAIAWITLSSGVIRYGGQVALALTGFGAISFVLPLLATAIFEAAAGYFVTREWPWRHPIDMKRWPGLLRDVRWIIWGNLMAGGLGQSYYLVVGLFVTKDVIGIFFFAMQLLVHVESVIGNTMQQVLVPVMTRFKSDAERIGGAAVRTIRMSMLITVPAAMGLAVVFPAIQEAVTLWSGKWAPAVWPLIILSIGYPLRVIFVGVASTILQAQGRWARWAWMWTLNAVGLTLVAGIVGRVFQTPVDIAIAVSAFMIFTGMVSTLRVVCELGVPARLVVGSCVASWAIGCTSAAAALCLEFANNIELVGINRLLVVGNAVALDCQTHTPIPPLVRILLCGGLFSAIYIAGARCVLSTHLLEALSMAPAAIGGRVARLMKLGQPTRM